MKSENYMVFDEICSGCLSRYSKNPPERELAWYHFCAAIFAMSSDSSQTGQINTRSDCFENGRVFSLIIGRNNSNGKQILPEMCSISYDA